MVRIGATAIAGSVLFFVVSNFISWLQQVEPYGYSLAGLGNCYVAAIPFYRGTFLGDLLCTGAIFGLYEVLALSLAARERPVIASQEVRA